LLIYKVEAAFDLELQHKLEGHSLEAYRQNIYAQHGYSGCVWAVDSHGNVCISMTAYRAGFDRGINAYMYTYGAQDLLPQSLSPVGGGAQHLQRRPSPVSAIDK